MNPHNLYTAEQDQWLRENWPKYGSDAVEMFNDKFGQHRTYQGIRSHCQRNLGVHLNRDIRSRVCRENSKHYVPVGTMRKTDDGYLEIKIADQYGRRNTNWERYHRYVYRQAHGSIPEGHVVIFLDGDRENCSVDNLIAVPQEINVLLMRKQLRSANGEITKAGITWCELYKELRDDGYFDRERERELERKKTARYKSLNADQKRPVYQCDLDGNVITRFDGISDAARAIGAEPTKITRCARGKAHTCMGYKWVYEE